MRCHSIIMVILEYIRAQPYEQVFLTFTLGAPYGAIFSPVQKFTRSYMYFKICFLLYFDLMKCQSIVIKNAGPTKCYKYYVH